MPTSEPANSVTDAVTVNILVDQKQPLRRIWRYIGYDEPNYTYTEAGRTLLGKLGQMTDGPYFVRCHFMLCNGQGQGSPKWGYTNVYAEGAAGEPIFDWTLIDRILDTVLEANCVPFVELGFMPRDLSSAPDGVTYEGAQAEGWRYPPKDYARWGELIRALALHTLQRYGLREVSRWYWELWNEPDIFYWAGTIDEYCRLFDYTQAALHAIIPQARLGGPGTTSPGREEAGAFLRAFLMHCSEGINAVTGAQGTRLDYVSFHTKGGGYGVEPDAPKKTPTMHTLVSHVNAGMEIIGTFPTYRQHEVVLSECDPDGWAAGSIRDNPNLFYRNTEYYASYVANAVCKLIDLQDEDGPRVDGMLTWAFQFEDREIFAGLRTLSTQGVDKPVLNVFRLLERLGGMRSALESQGVRDPLLTDGAMATNTPPDISGIAAMSGDGGIQILLCSHHDDWDREGTTRINLEIEGLAEGSRYAVQELRVDARHSNSHTAWQAMGSPAYPDDDQIQALQDAAALRPRTLGAVQPAAGCGRLALDLQSHSVCLIELLPLDGQPFV